MISIRMRTVAVSQWTGDVEHSCLLYTAQTVLMGYVIEGMLFCIFQALEKLSIHEEFETGHVIKATIKIFLG